MTDKIDVEHAYPRIKAALDILADWIKRADFHGHANDEFHDLEPADVDVIARDLGMTQSELRAVARQGRDSAALLLKRMTALHLDPAKVAGAHPAVMHDLERLCSTCQARGRCSRDLLKDPDDKIWTSYCPNSATLTALKS